MPIHRWRPTAVRVTDCGRWPGTPRGAACDAEVRVLSNRRHVVPLGELLHPGGPQPDLGVLVLGLAAADTGIGGEAQRDRVAGGRIHGIAPKVVWMGPVASISIEATGPVLSFLRPMRDESRGSGWTS